MPVKKQEPETPSSFRKISFGGIQKKKESAKSSHPAVPDPSGELAATAARILQRHAEVEALSGALDVDKAELKVLAAPFYFQIASGKIEVPTGVIITCDAGEVLISFPNRYGKLDTEERLFPILGAKTSSYFRQAFVLEIDGDKLPGDKAEALLSEVQRIFAKYGASDALNVKEGIKPVPDFHVSRHSALTPAENLAIDQVCPIISMVKPKPRK